MFLLGLRVSPAVIPRLSVPPSVMPAWFDLDNDGRIDETRDEKEAVVSICKCAAKETTGRKRERWTHTGETGRDEYAGKATKAIHEGGARD